MKKIAFVLTGIAALVLAIPASASERTPSGSNFVQLAQADGFRSGRTVIVKRDRGFRRGGDFGRRGHAFGRRDGGSRTVIIKRTDRGSGTTVVKKVIRR
jgi:hypothetical protein